MADETGNLTTAAAAGELPHKAVAYGKSQGTANLPVGRSTDYYPGLVPMPDGVPDAYRLHPSGLVVYKGHGRKWYTWDSKLPLVFPPSPEAIAAATPLFLTGQAVTP